MLHSLGTNPRCLISYLFTPFPTLWVSSKNFMLSSQPVLCHVVFIHVFSSLPLCVRVCVVYVVCLLPRCLRVASDTTIRLWKHQYGRVSPLCISSQETAVALPPNGKLMFLNRLSRGGIGGRPSNWKAEALSCLSNTTVCTALEGLGQIGRQMDRQTGRCKGLLASVTVVAMDACSAYLQWLPCPLCS